MSTLSKLAKDASIYGFSSILARMINFLFVPLYTRQLSTMDFGIYTELFAYLAMLGVVLTFGLETGFFRFTSKDPKNADAIFNNILSFLALVALSFYLVIWLFVDQLADVMGHSSWAILFAAAILAIESYIAVFFARLRLQSKVLRFACFRFIKIISEVVFNLLLFFVLPIYFKHHPDSILLSVFTPTPSFIYIFGAIFLSCLVSFLLFLPDILKTRLTLDWHQLKPILIYSFPLMISGVQGVLNDLSDRLLFRFFSPAGQVWESVLGIFNANTKLAVIMLMFVQMFRYAAEPFFFSNANQTNSRQQQAVVMYYFSIFCVFIFLFITAYTNFFVLLLGQEYRVGVGVLPIMLLANLLMGINQNLSMWYKLAEQTKIALVITFAGLLSSVFINILFMPIFGYYAAASAHIISNLVMIIISWELSKQYYLIPYNWKRISLYILLGLSIFGTHYLYTDSSLIIQIGLNTLGIILFGYLVIRIEKIDLQQILTKVRIKMG